ncbi:hypothetical protein HK100_010300, partial [Physocladia obscura]
LIDDGEKFHRYAMQAMSEFQEQGKDVTPVIRGVIRKPLPFPESPYGIHPNTYQRLGFTVRYLPTECPVKDPWKNRKCNGEPKIEQ